MNFKVRKLSYALGAEIAGIDISKPLDEKTFKEINSAFLEHCVLVFPNQPLTRPQHVAFSRYFGELNRNETKASYKQPPGFPEISLNISKPKPTGEAATERISGEDWHIDRSHLPVAAQASLLLGIEIPEVGGDTEFANMYRAYDTLSEGMKKLLEGLDGVHLQGPNDPCSAHPIVRIHPETGRKSLYVSEQVKIIVGMTPEESKPLLQYLTQHAVRPQNIYRHKWHKNDLVMWDGRCTLHKALGNYDRTQVRHMERTTVNGNMSGYIFDGPRE